MVGIEVVSIEDVPSASLCFTPLPIMTFFCISDMFTLMPEVGTSSETNIVIEASGGMTLAFSGMVGIGDPTKFLVVSILNTSTKRTRPPVSSKIDLTGESLCGVSKPNPNHDELEIFHSHC